MFFSWGWDYWELYHKITVDAPNRLIYVNDDVANLDIKIDVYSAIKEVWTKLTASYGFARFDFPIRTIGGDATTGGKTAGDIYFLINGWRIVADPTVTTIQGVLYSDDYDTAWLLEKRGQLQPFFPNEVSNLVQTAAGTGGADAESIWQYPTRTLTGGVPSAADIAAQVWNTAYNNHDLDGTTGHLLNYIKNLHKRIYVDTEAVTNGNGSQELPYNNITSAIDRAEEDGIRELEIKGDILLDRNVKNFDIHGIGLPVIDCNGFNIQGSHFSEVKFKGTYSTGTNPNNRGNVIVRDSLILDVTTLEGFFENCAFQGNMIMNADSYAFLKDCASAIPGTNRPTISMGVGTEAQLNIRGYNGGLTIKDCDTVNDVVTVELSAGSLTFDSSCTAGIMVARGVGNFVDQTNGATVIDETLNRASLASNVAIDYGLVSDAVWDHLLTDMNTAGSAGERLKALLTLNKYLGLS